MITLEPLTDADVTAIHQWPPYQKPFDVLDYALRSGGWLDNYPDSKTNVRYGIWQHGKLIGFSLLTDVKSGEAEFYIALHPDHTRRNVGREATVQTIRRGFREYGLNRIHLKVRDWHQGARRMYAGVGFQERGSLTELVQGKPVAFVKMELDRPRPFKGRWKALVDSFRTPV